MKKIMRTSIILFLGIGMLMSCSSDDDQAEVSDVINSDQFKNDASGWQIVGDAQGGYVEASYSPDGGVVDGYIFAKDDVTGGVWYFSSPSSYHGNKQVYYGATLSYSLFQDSGMSNQFLRGDVIFRSGEKTIYYQIANFPNATWTDYSVRINENSGWQYGEYDNGNEPLATKEQIQSVLSNVTDFWIRGEYETGPDKGGLDNVIIRNN